MAIRLLGNSLVLHGQPLRSSIVRSISLLVAADTLLCPLGDYSYELDLDRVWLCYSK
jgi:hypothetical protein